MMDSLRNTTPHAVKGLFERAEMQQEPVTVSDTQKVYLSVKHVYLNSIFCGPMFKSLTK